MLSVEPFTMDQAGYPLLLQTGEEFDGQPLHDRQHPHDLFMEIAATYRHALSANAAVELYVAAVGEPALGPTAFPHRASAESDPLAPLGHHWEDSTHISFGVATLGFVLARNLKLEASVFNGREPDEIRTNFDFRTLDSASGRVSFALSGEWTMQASLGYLASPEEHDPDVSVRRFTASVSRASAFGASGHWASTFVVGRNAPSRGDATLPAGVPARAPAARRRRALCREPRLPRPLDVLRHRVPDGRDGLPEAPAGADVRPRQ
jgi:hypothetical protein